MDTSMCEENSDDEVFVGMTRKEVKIRFGVVPGQSKNFRLIKTHSAPDLRYLAADSLMDSSPQFGLPADDSFIQKENLINKLCSSTSSNKFDSTFEMIDFILKNEHNIKESKQDEMKSNKIVAPLKSSKNTPVKDIKQTESDVFGSPHYFTPYTPLCVNATPPASTSPHYFTPYTPLCVNGTPPASTSPHYFTPYTLFCVNATPPASTSPHYFTPYTPLCVNATPPASTSPHYFTPYTPLCVNATPPASTSPHYFTPYTPLFVNATPPASTSKTPVFKTPAYPSAWKKTATPREKPGKIHSYQHISSPIASYIRNSPQVPLVKDVHPKKELPRATSTTKTTPVTINKENIHLPSVAYKSAKTTKVIQIPDQDKLPQSKSAKNMISSSARPSVMRHENRMNPIKQRLLSNEEHSFANLSCHQAEVSLCTEKTAFKSTNKHK